MTADNAQSLSHYSHVHHDYAHLPVTVLAGVSKPIAYKLAALNIYRLFDLVLHLPRDYEDKSRVVPISQLEHGISCVVVGVVSDVVAKNGLSVMLSDRTGCITLKFFNTYPTLLNTMVIGQSITAFGEIKVSRFGVQMIHPEYFVTGTRRFESGLLPVYPTAKGLHQNKLRTLIKTALAYLKTQLLCLGCDELIASGVSYVPHHTLYEALSVIHTPKPDTDIDQQAALITALKEYTHDSVQRLILEELTAHQLAFLFRRQNIYQYKAPLCVKTSPLANRLIQSLPFLLTNAQQRVVGEIVKDMTSLRPMLRLVQGDVGAGKTLVAALSACHAIDGGWQVAIMAPTEILAKQHFVNFEQWFAPLGVAVGFVASKQSAKQRQITLDNIKQGQIDIVVGTHALFYDDVVFAQLGFCVIDEQHRFGVEQRLRLANKGIAGSTPHQLAMTATPIPRTLAMSLYGDMDISVIDQLPPNRTPIVTVMAKRSRRDEVLGRVYANCLEGKQAYWVCPLIEDDKGDSDSLQSAEAMYAELSSTLDIRVGLVHGKMRGDDKQSVMAAFKQGDIDLLIATTVIEVGVDVPNASLMVIENAERLGLSQLHQLRGRVGRGATQSFCVLLYQDTLCGIALERLRVIKDNTDGFVISEADMRLRGAGELLGKRQTGDMGYYVADMVRDEMMLLNAQKAANYLLQTNKAKAMQLATLWLDDNQAYLNA